LANIPLVIDDEKFLSLQSGQKISLDTESTNPITLL
jgi:hypothetical protein